MDSRNSLVLSNGVKGDFYLSEDFVTGESFSYGTFKGLFNYGNNNYSFIFMKVDNPGLIPVSYDFNLVKVIENFRGDFSLTNYVLSRYYGAEFADKENCRFEDMTGENKNRIGNLYLDGIIRDITVKLSS